MIRGLGPSLSAHGVSPSIVLTNPYLELNSADGIAPIAVNDDWQQGDISRIPAGFHPTNASESLIIATLPIGPDGFSQYTAILKGANGETGIGLAEIYDLDAASAPAQLANVSTRGFVQGGDDVMIGGFIIGGSDAGTQIVVRAIGSSLAGAGIANALADPTLDLRDVNGEPLSFNDNWQDDPAQAAELTGLGIAPKDNAEAAIITTIPPGNYTATVAGKSGAAGVALVEVYTVN